MSKHSHTAKVAFAFFEFDESELRRLVLQQARAESREMPAFKIKSDGIASVSKDEYGCYIVALELEA